MLFIIMQNLEIFHTEFFGERRCPNRYGRQLSCEMHSNDLKDEVTVITYVLVRFKSYGVPSHQAQGYGSLAPEINIFFGGFEVMELLHGWKGNTELEWQSGVVSMF
jgi:hypothetical protein